MRKSLAIGATLIVALTAPSAATAQNQFSVGSAKTDLNVQILVNSRIERASFSAHNQSQAPSCNATGQIVYEGLTAAFTAKINELTLVGKAAAFRGIVTKARRGVVPGALVDFNTYDSGMPGGDGDLFLFEGVPMFPVACELPHLVGSHPITSGNIVVKTT